ncbi:MAG: hypothetical protein WCL06_14215, partial [Bacteroidota bacterium]
MKTKLLFIIMLAFAGLSSFAQVQKIKLDESKKIGSATKSEMFTVQCKGAVNPPSADLKWRPILTKKIIETDKEEAPDQILIEKIKSDKLKLQQLQDKNNTDTSAEISTKSVTPVVGTNWWGNANNGCTPMDNQIAISNGGIVVSVANTTLEIDDISGNSLYYDDLMTFINDNTVNAICDPAVIYDPGADRFIFFCQDYIHPLNSSNTHLLIFFSQTNNPATGGWWYYQLSGNPLNDNSAFDYPKLAVSNNELYITGNLYYDSGGNNQSVLWQINKWDGYSGANLNAQTWSGIQGSPFTLLPVSYGQGNTYGPGCYLVSTTSGGASTINLYDLTDDMTGTPSLNYYSVSTTTYSPAADAQQSGTTVLLDNGACRALSGFYMNGIIHFVFHSDQGNTYNGINYNRLNVSTLSNTSSIFGISGLAYSYPSVVSYATTSTDKSVMIGFGRSGASIYPEVRVINCDNNMNWSTSTLVKSSSSYVNQLQSSGISRWGDYTGTARKHNSSTPSIWMNGMYGTSSNSWDSWIAEIHDNTITGINNSENKNEFKVFPNPIIETFN